MAEEKGLGVLLVPPSGAAPLARVAIDGVVRVGRSSTAAPTD